MLAWAYLSFFLLRKRCVVVRQSAINPSANTLHGGVNEQALLEAIDKSGYPLQGIVASKLHPTFFVTEEWGYIDRDTGEHRALDLHAYKPLGKKRIEIEPLEMCPAILMLIECKRAVHPLVFFQNAVAQSIPNFPAVCGLKGRISIDDAKGTTAYVPGPQALSLDQLPFVSSVCLCSSFSRAVLSGSKIELSGSEVFNGLILPLVKAFDHAEALHQPSQNSIPLFPTLVLCVGVIDAPMLLVESPDLAKDPVMTPWVRVVRQEAATESNSWQRYRYYGIDVVHIGYFDAFIREHVMPAATEFSARALKMSDVLLRGGQADDLTNFTWDQIRVRPKK
jgi:hypothetical protein